MARGYTWDNFPMTAQNFRDPEDPVEPSDDDFIIVDGEERPYDFLDEPPLPIDDAAVFDDPFGLNSLLLDEDDEAEYWREVHADEMRENAKLEGWH